MSMHDDIKTVLVSEEQLKAKVAELGAQISRDYAGKKDEYSYGPDKGELLSQDEGRKHPGGHRFRKGESVSLTEGNFSYAFCEKGEGKYRCKD